ncbi:MAG: lipoprotein-releasing ABC transporter ATP-binding protein LolD [Gammaproteobacteria bacterium]|nr:lipoprotein-releasing ABC transporter ATP-binding protein LolD [Gammaproteobacteria bacterium]NNF59777.1 lipoprotein-releasing ABC transporter ATP-binding protein LolD [Gammaproteobacteria bacterium]NNM20971.1 lipoprotein-releasing ABC transporter ATP-binding protein LolD [Gammaproteobacteria bacterium]
MNDAGPADLALRCENISRSYPQASGRLEVLRDIELDVAPGERISIIGASGSGKTTLLQIMGGLDDPTSGRIFINGRDLSQLSDAERGEMRNRRVGFVYQFHHLLPEFSALENVAMPLLIRRVEVAKARQQAADLLQRVGLGERLEHKPAQLSGGERQRAAVARALITGPALVLADEPTGNLDGRTGARVFETMLELNRELGTSLVVVTHDMRIARHMDRILTLEEGVLRPASVDG